MPIPDFATLEPEAALPDFDTLQPADVPDFASLQAEDRLPADVQEKLRRELNLMAGGDPAAVREGVFNIDTEGDQLSGRKGMILRSGGDVIRQKVADWQNEHRRTDDSVAASFSNAGQDVVGGLLDPDNALYMAAGGPAGRVLGKAFGGQMVAGAGVQGVEAGKALAKGDTKEARDKAIEAIVQGALGGSMLGHGGPSEMPSLQPIEGPIEPRPTPVAAPVAPGAPVTPDVLTDLLNTLTKGQIVKEPVSPLAPEAGGQPTPTPAAPILQEMPMNPGGALADLPPELQAKSNAVKDQMAAQLPALRTAKEIGFTFKAANQRGAFDMSPEELAKLSPEDQANFKKFAETQPNQWEFTDNRPDSPTKSLTFYTPEGATPEQIKAAHASKLAEVQVQSKSAGGASVKEIQLGLNRPDIEDQTLKTLSDDEFDVEFRTAKKKVNEAEKAFDDNPEITPEQRQKIADAQDRWSAADLERLRRNYSNTHTEDVFRKMIDFADIGNESNYARFKVLANILKERQGVKSSDVTGVYRLLPESLKANPDFKEALGGKLEKFKSWLERASEEGKPATQPDFETLKPEAAGSPRVGEQGVLFSNPLHEIIKQIPRDVVDMAKDIYRTVKNIGEWTAEMIRRGGEAVKPHLENLWNFVKSGIEEAKQERESGVEPARAGRLYMNPFHEVIKDLPEKGRDLFKWADTERKKVVNRIKRRHEYDVVSATKDSADNRATKVASEAANIVLHDLNRAFKVKPELVKSERNELRENALTSFIEAGGTREGLDVDRMKLKQTDESSWQRRALRANEYATEHFDKLQPVAELYKRITDAENAYENSHGVKTLYRKGGYVFHAMDVDESFGTPAAGSVGGGSTPAPFKHIRDHPSYADAIAAGVVPKSLNAIDLLNARISMGQRLVNYGDWVDGMADITDPVTKLAVVTKPIERTKADGTTDTVAPAGYSLINFGGRNLALHKGYAGLFGDLTNPSIMRSTNTREALMKVAATSKHMTLAADTYHLGRLAFWNAMSRGDPRLWKHERGVTLLENTVPELRKMAERGEIPKEWLKAIEEDKGRLERLVKAGLNVGNIGDNLYSDWVQKIPILGTFNKWLFSQFQRGVMSEVGLNEMRRLEKLHPEWSEFVVARQAAKDVNTRFGNLQSQSFIKNKTLQDMARLIFLAPQWNESLIRSELGAVKQFGQGGLRMAKGQRPAFGLLAKGIGTALVAQFLANQLINYGTRGVPTWENKEGEDQGAAGWAGSKISAYLPDYVGGGPGFFLNPMSLPLEIMHLLFKSTERNGGDFTEAVKEFARGRLNIFGKPIYTFFTGEDMMGKPTKGGVDKLKTMAAEMVPVPISGGAVYRAGKQMLTGEHQEQYAGQFQRQAMQSFGVKTESVPGPDSRMYDLAKRFQRAKGIAEHTYSEGPYTAITRAVRLGNMTDANAAILETLKQVRDNGEPRTVEEIRKYYAHWQDRPYTQSKALEQAFVRSLSPAQQAVYSQARAQRKQVAAQVERLLRDWSVK